MILGTIDVIGTKYTVYLQKDFNKLQEEVKEYNKRFNIQDDNIVCDGYCLTAMKEIHICQSFSEEYNKIILLHEATHALLYEVGYSHWDDEDFVNKLSIWFPMMEKIAQQWKEIEKNARVEEEPRSKKNHKTSISKSK